MSGKLPDQPGYVTMVSLLLPKVWFRTLGLYCKGKGATSSLSETVFAPPSLRNLLKLGGGAGEEVWAK